MNAQRRKEILRAADLIEQAREILQNATEEEAEAFDNMPESLQESERGQKMLEYIDSLETAVSQLEEAAEVAENCDCMKG